MALPPHRLFLPPSMSFTNALRTQARLALTPCRARSALSAFRPLVHQNVVASRLFSTSRRLCFDGESTQHDSQYTRPRKARQMEPHPPSSTIFVGGLPANATEEVVLEIFNNFGDIARVTVGNADPPFFPISPSWFLDTPKLSRPERQRVLQSQICSCPVQGHG